MMKKWVRITLDKVQVLIRYLRKKGRVKGKELSELLDVNTRSVKRIVDKAKEQGFDISSHFGNTNQGYELHEERLTYDEWKEVCDKLPEELKDKIKRIINRVY